MTTKATSISTEVANQLKTNWAACLPGNLSNLFYNVKAKGTIKRYNNYFSLGLDGINHLLSGDPTKTIIRIYMGSSEVFPSGSDEDVGTFTPLLCIVTDGIEKYYQLEYVEEDLAGGLKFVNITPEIAELFCSKWKELSDTEVADAFSGVTVQKLDITMTQPEETLRVISYDFPPQDTIQIVDHLKGIKTGRYLHLMLGAGLTVRLTHPFNFRPILAVPYLDPNSGKKIEYSQAFYERSHPCPPYCPLEK